MQRQKIDVTFNKIHQWLWFEDFDNSKEIVERSLNRGYTFLHSLCLLSWIVWIQTLCLVLLYNLSKDKENKRHWVWDKKETFWTVGIIQTKEGSCHKLILDVCTLQLRTVKGKLAVKDSTCDSIDM